MGGHNNPERDPDRDSDLPDPYDPAAGIDPAAPEDAADEPVADPDE